MQRQFNPFAGVCARAMGMLLGLFLCAIPASHARAYEEQVSVDLALGYAGIAKSKTLNSSLGSVDVGAALGISDFLVLRAALGYGVLAESKTKTQHALRGRLEGAYLVDVLKWVPFFGLGVGAWGVWTGGDLTFRPTGHLLVGFDWLATRQLTLGVDVRIGMLLESGDLVSWTEGQLRASWLFDLF